jgi:hypothetical protein
VRSSCSLVLMALLDLVLLLFVLIYQGRQYGKEKEMSTSEPLPKPPLAPPQSLRPSAVTESIVEVPSAAPLVVQEVPFVMLSPINPFDPMWSGASWNPAESNANEPETDTRLTSHPWINTFGDDTDAESIKIESRLRGLPEGSHSMFVSNPLQTNSHAVLFET